MVEIQDLTFKYSKGSPIQFPNLTVAQGEHCLLLGQSGSGKTTLLHILGGLLRNYSGSIKVANQELARMSESALDHFRGTNIGFVFQKNHLISALSVEKNILLAPYLSGSEVEHERVTEVLERLGISQKRKSAVTEISQGQAQRVAMARAILTKPALILADEPTSALDDKSCEQVIQLLLDVANEYRSTLVIATHDQRLKDKITKQVLLTSTF